MTSAYCIYHPTNVLVLNIANKYGVCDLKFFSYYHNVVYLESLWSIPNVYCYFMFALSLLCVLFVVKLNQIILETILAILKKLQVKHAKGFLLGILLNI